MYHNQKLLHPNRKSLFHTSNDFPRIKLSDNRMLGPKINQHLVAYLFAPSSNLFEGEKTALFYVDGI